MTWTSTENGGRFFILTLLPLGRARIEFCQIKRSDPICIMNNLRSDEIPISRLCRAANRSIRHGQPYPDRHVVSQIVLELAEEPLPLRLVHMKQGQIFVLYKWDSRKRTVEIKDLTPFSITTP